MEIKYFLTTIRHRFIFHTYSFEIKCFNLPNDGYVEYAQWLHPLGYKDEISQSAIDELRNYLSEGDVAIDIGAYTGDTAIPIAVAVGKNGLVLAFEPNKYVFPVLQKNETLRVYGE